MMVELYEWNSWKYPGHGKFLKYFLLIVCLLFMSTHVTSQDRSNDAGTLNLEHISRYLDKLITGKTAFTQYNSDGTISSGNFYFKRPWHARLEYNHPETALIIAQGLRVAVFDLKSNTNPAIYPLRLTPLHLLLAPDIALDDPRYFQGFVSGPQRSVLYLKQDSNNIVVKVELEFNNDPLRILGWVYEDSFGQRIKVELVEIIEISEFQPNFFSIEIEMESLGK